MRGKLTFTVAVVLLGSLMSSAYADTRDPGHRDRHTDRQPQQRYDDRGGRANGNDHRSDHRSWQPRDVRDDNHGQRDYRTDHRNDRPDDRDRSHRDNSRPDYRNWQPRDVRSDNHGQRDDRTDHRQDRPGDWDRNHRDNSHPDHRNWDSGNHDRRSDHGNWDRRTWDRGDNGRDHRNIDGRSYRNYDGYRSSYDRYRSVRHYDTWRYHNAHPRYHAGVYYRPLGYRTYHWYPGARLPVAYYAPRYVVYDYYSYGLWAPPRGYHWVRVDNDVVLAAITTGIVLTVVDQIFW